MDVSAAVESLRRGQCPAFPPDAAKRLFAEKLDAQDELRHLREQFILPTTRSLKKKALNQMPVNGSGADTASHCNGNRNGVQNGDTQDDAADSPSIYLVGNSLGAQPKAVRRYLDAQLETWASIGVNGHFSGLDESPLVAWQDMAEDCATKSVDIVGALPSEIVVMNTLTANLHFMMASFYRPTEKRHKIILEWKPFPSDWYAIESQIKWHGLDPAQSMVEIQPDDNFYIPTEKILSVIDQHASDTALLLLPGIQYYSGQLFDIPRITRYAQERGIVVGWDLAHAAGNVELRLHDWNVDFAVWCTYKYINAGPGAIAGAFVHERHGKVERSQHDGQQFVFRPRLAGWYGGDKAVRFNMAKTFQPTPGAGGFQVSNPSVIDLASLSAALSVFNQTSMAALRDKSLLLTAYTEHLLNDILAAQSGAEQPPFRIITPKDPLERGTQLSVLLRPGLLEHVGKALKEGSVVCDQRKPDVIRVAPVPLYCTFLDAWRFAEIFRDRKSVV